jgi:SAM-dependent methyltransferase
MNRKQTITTYEDIDWHLLWQSARAKKTWKSKGSKDWDKKAGSFSERNKQSPYISLFLNHLKLTPDMTVLDVGCGPGTLALPIAEKVREVVALDYSDGMLASLELRAKELGITNIKTLNCAWEDDWHEKAVGVHHIAIASRSMNIDNLADGIRKLDAHASKQVFIADRIDPSPFDPDAFRAIGREFNSGPDYIYTVNTLYDLGIHPCISHIELASELEYKNIEEALDAYKWMFRDLSDIEEKSLHAFLESRIIRREGECVVIKRRFPQRWALIWWKKRQ